MKKVIFIVTVILLVSGLILSGCAAPSQPAAPKPSQPSTPPPAAKPIELTMAWTTTGTMGNEAFPQWAKMVETACGGKVTVKTFPAGSMGTAQEQYDQVVKDVVDIGWQFCGLYESRMPLTGVVMLPLVCPSGDDVSQKGSRVIMDLFNKFPEMQKHFFDVKPLFLHFGLPNIIATVDKKINTLEDLKGLKLRAPGGQVAKFLQKAGVSTQMIAAPEMNTALQTGLIKGAVASWEAQDGFKLIELQKYFLDSYVVGSTAFFMIMNKDKYASLPADIQKGIDSVSGITGALSVSKLVDRDVAKYKDRAKKAGGTIYTLPDAELPKWQKLGDEINALWIADMKTKGLPGQEIYDEALRLVKQYSK